MKPAEGNGFNMSKNADGDNYDDHDAVTVDVDKNNV